MSWRVKDNKWTQTYTSFSGVDIFATFENVLIGNMSGISWSVSAVPNSYRRKFERPTPSEAKIRRRLETIDSIHPYGLRAIYIVNCSFRRFCFSEQNNTFGA